MKINDKNFLISFLIRYSLILFSAINGLWIFYFIFQLPTTYLSAYLLKITGETIIISNQSFLFNTVFIEIIEACVAGSAYFLLFILAMSIPNIKLFKRLNLILFTFASFFILNVIRIFILANISTTNFFNIVHMSTWYFVSTAMVILIWFSGIKIFKIKEIPIYSDFKYLLKKVKIKKKK